MLMRATNLGFAYGRRMALRQVSLGLDSGRIVALLGPNGSGKSTLMHVLLGHLRGSGQITWDEVPLENWSRRALARRVAYLPQFASFEPGQTVAQTLRLGRAPYWGPLGLESPRDLQVVHEVAALLDLTDLLDRPMDQLSGGQRQRALIGRCLSQEPAALLLDEPSASLDLKHHLELLQLLRRLCTQRHLGVLMASHDLNLAGAFADELVLLCEGQVAQAGAPQALLHEDLIQRVYGVPVQRIERPGQAPAVLPRL